MKLTQPKLFLWAAAMAAAFCGAGTGARADYPSQVLSFQPLTYWRFSETPPAVTATNLGTLGAAANGTYNSGLQPSADTLVSPAFPGFGAANTGLAFQGTGQTLVIGYTNIPAPWTFVCWVNPQTPPGGSAALMYSSTTALKLDQWDNTLMVGFTAYGVADYTFNYSAPDGAWVNLAFVGTGSNTLLYVNGSLQDSNAASITLPMTSIGNPAGDFLNGTVGEVATFGTALMDGQIRTLYLTAVGDQNPPGFVQNVPLISPPGTIYATTPFSLSVDAYGAGPLSYQWLKGGTVVGTNTTYAQASASLADNGNYDVIVTNPYGSATSAVVTLAVNSAQPPAITQAPAARPVYPGGTAPFTVAASGTPPLSFQWKANGTNIAGATNATLIITNAGAADAASYSVGVTNSAGGVVSAGVALTLTTPAAGSYEAAVLASGPIAYWRLNEKSGNIAYDYQGANDGVYTNVSLAQAGYSALDIDTSAGFETNPPSRVIVTDSAPFNFSGLTPSFSFEIWANFTSLSGVERLFSNGLPGGYGLGFGVNTASGLRFTTFGVQDFDEALPTPLELNTWYHIAGVSEGGNFYFYLDGQLVGTVAYAGAALPSPAPFELGCNAVGTAYEAVGGELAEAAFYDRALTAGQIVTHFSVGRSGPSAPGFVANLPVISPSGTIYVTTPFSISADAYGAGPLSYQWLKDGTLVGTNITYAEASASVADSGHYDLIVTSPYGSATSAVVTLSVNPAQPPAGADYASQVLAFQPLTYWRFSEPGPSSLSATNLGTLGAAANGTYSTNLLPSSDTLVSPAFPGFGPTNMGLAFDGIAEPFEIGYTNIPTPWTAVCWVNRQDAPGGSAVLMYSSTAALKLEQYNGTRMVGFTAYGVADYLFDYEAPTGTWVNLAFVGTGTNTLLYVNGLELAPNAASITLPMTSIGGPAGDYMSGTVGEVATFGTALSDGQIRTLYLTAMGDQNAPGLVQNVPMISPAGTIYATMPFSISADAYGAGPLTYQWRLNGTVVGTDITYAKASASRANNGNYDVIVTNPYGSVTSSAVTLTLSVLPVPTFANLTNGLMLHLTFDGNTTDSSGRQNNATALGSPTFVPGKLNQAIALSTVANNSYNYLTVSDNNGDLSFTATNSFSVALWLKFTTGFNALPIIGNAVSSVANAGWVLTENAGKFEWSAVGLDTGSVVANPAGGPLINDGNWHHLAVVFDRSASNAVSYVDGQWIDTRSIAGLGNLDDGATLTIGQDPTGVYAVSGSFALDDLGIWRRALSGYEVLSIYEAAQLSNESFDVYGPVSVSIAPDGAQVILAWQAGTLESADALQGAQTVWTPVAGAAPPSYTFQASAAHKFYRIKL